MLRTHTRFYFFDSASVMNPLLLLPLVGTLVSANPTAVVRKNAFADIEIVYKNLDHQRYVLFQIEAYINNKWILVDNNLNCKELKSSIIISCSPTKVQQVNVLSFALKDCELIYAYPYKSYDKLLIRLKTLNYHVTKISYTIDKMRYFTPFWLKK